MPKKSLAQSTRHEKDGTDEKEFAKKGGGARRGCPRVKLGRKTTSEGRFPSWGPPQGMKIRTSRRYTGKDGARLKKSQTKTMPTEKTLQEACPI